MYCINCNYCLRNKQRSLHTFAHSASTWPTFKLLLYILLGHALCETRMEYTKCDCAAVLKKDT